MKSLSHSGVVVSEYEPKGFKIKLKGKEIALTPDQEEMAIAWVKKLGTEYVEDPVFAKNFFEDFCKALGAGSAKMEDFDFSEIEEFVQRERELKANVSKEEKKELAAKRKQEREENKKKYGYVLVDGEPVEISNYVVEPSSIFMGRGKHPLRGRWKQGAKKSDITLNLSKDSKVPEGDWKEVIWNPDYMWVARWDDKLTGKKKYVWLSENSHIRQRKEIEKFEKASTLDEVYPEIRKHIERNMASDDIKKRKVATVAYLIDTLNIRVGDEKDEDEADTVGASTLAKKNIILKGGDLVEFDFLGKDSVRLKKDVKFPEQVVKNLSEFLSIAKSPDSRVFDGIRSETVSDFLDEVAPGMSAKVFRTYHATKAVEKYFKENNLKESDAESRKKHAAKIANLQAAIVCNHKRTIPKNWQDSLEKRKMKLIERKEKCKLSLEKMNDKLKKSQKAYEEKLSSHQKKLAEMESELESIKKSGASGKASSKEKAVKSQREKIKKLNSKFSAQKKKLEKMIEKKKIKDREYLESMKLQIEEQEMTKDYNLGTSLKSYIDPRVYKEWCSKVGFDWKKYYSKTLQRKFSWVEK